MLYLGVTEYHGSVTFLSVQVPTSNMQPTNVRADKLGFCIGHSLWGWILGEVISYGNEIWI